MKLFINREELYGENNWLVVIYDNIINSFVSLFVTFLMLALPLFLAFRSLFLIRRMRTNPNNGLIRQEAPNAEHNIPVNA